MLLLLCWFDVFCFVFVVIVCGVFAFCVFVLCVCAFVVALRCVCYVRRLVLVVLSFSLFCCSFGLCSLWLF